MDLGERSGNRAVGIGEVPYFDPASVSKAAALGKEKVVKSNGAANGPQNGASHGGHGMAMGGHGGGGCPSQNGKAAGVHGNGMAH
jgi:hypothetical protein